MKGPPIASFGFWMSMPESDICAAMTHTTSDVWDANPIHCKEIIESRFESVHVMVQTAFVWLTVVLAANAFIKRVALFPSLFFT
eukprot:9993785-Prorocentrum_lima.AAC.1